MEELFELLKELRPEHDFRSSEDYIEDGLLDSFDIITLIDMIQEKYGVVIDGLDIVPENFCSVDAIAALIRNRGGTI